MNDVTKTEVNMGYVQGFVNLIAQALVAATELPKQIEAMQNDLTTLHSDLDRTKQRNIELDTLTGDLRRQRDEAEQALSQAKNDAAMANNNLVIAKSQAENYQHDLETTRTELANVRKERDDYGMKQIEAEDRAKSAEAKLDKLREAMGIPKEVAKPVESMPEPYMKNEGPTFSQPDQVMPDPAPPKRVYEGEGGFYNFPSMTEKFDTDRGLWYRTA